MNKYLILGIIILAIAVFSGYRLMAQTKMEEKMDTQNKKILVAYYSYSGNTQKIANAIHEKIGGDIFEIKTEGSYPEEYRAMTQQAQKEIQSGFRPKLTTKVENIGQYDIIFIGSPNWWGTITPQVSSFLESYDLSGKKIIPFITHGGGGKQNTITDIKAQCKGCDVVSSGWSGYGSMSIGLSSWLEDLGFKI